MDLKETGFESTYWIQLQVP